MSAKIYNASLAVGLLLIAAGIGMVSVPAALVTSGALILALTLFGAYLSRKR